MYVHKSKWIEVGKLGKKWVIPISLIALLLFLMLSPNPSAAFSVLPNDLNVGPYVDKIVYKVIANQDQRILALQSGEIEMDTSFFDPVHLQTLDADPDIDIYEAVRNGYGHITIDCSYYPLNISGLRRAFAYAFNKTRVTTEIMDGFSVEHDSLVPLPNSWSIEDELDWHYYDARPDIGNQILDDLGFSINETTGFRDAPNGDAFEINILYASSSQEIAGGVAQLGVDALRSLHIDASSVSDHGHTAYNMVFYTTNFIGNDVDWLAYEYWSENADDPYQYSTNFSNATYDSWRDQLLHGTTYEEVYEAAAEMQKILHYNVPRLVVYENTYMQGYRVDQFTGHVPDLGQYISGSWTLRKIHKIDQTRGGTVSIAVSQEPDTFNIFETSSEYSLSVMEELWPSLYKYGPDLTPHPYLAEATIVETHEDNPAVPDGHTRFTIDIIQNATWTDGTPLTAEDIAFSYTYSFETGSLGNPAASDLGDLVAAYAPTPFRIVVEFNTESYWHFSNFAFDFVIPKHIFNDIDGIGYAGWNTWNPVFDPSEPHVTSGPFILSDYKTGEFYEISVNTDFAYYPSFAPINTFDPVPSGSPTTEEIGEPIDLVTLTSIAIAGATTVVIIVMVVEIFHYKHGKQN